MIGADVSDLAAAIGDLSVDGRTVSVYAGVPDRFTPPAVVVEPAEPWIDNAVGYPHGVVELHYRARCIAGQGTTTKQQAFLSALVSAVLSRLYASQTWTPGSTTAPFALEVRENVAYLSADMTVSALATITED